MSSQPRRAARLAALLLVLAAACTSEPGRPELRHVDVDGSSAPSSGASKTSEPTAPSDIAELGGRLAVLDESGNLVTVNPDGSDEVVLAEVEPGLSQVRQPAWSPDGRRVAWVLLQVTETNALSAAVATATGRGAKTTQARTAIVPFYLSWDPTSSRIAYLGSPAENEIELAILEVAGRSEGTPLDTGQPFYLSWAPAGDELLVHVGDTRLDRLDLDGSRTAVADRPGAFTAPVWTADGETFVYASASSGQQQLVVRDVDADASKERALVPFRALISFVVSPDGERIAFQVREEDRSLPLSVVEVVSGETIEVTETPTAAFFWSPNGEHLLYLNPDPEDDQLWFRWGVWDGTSSSFLTPRFLPSPLMIDQYLPFFEQYAQSTSLWSPDGSAFAYPGTSEDGRTGIWIQSARSDRAPVLVAGGDFVAWSPS
jgi:TolB protein